MSSPVITLRRGQARITLWANPGRGYTLTKGSTGLGLAPVDLTLDAVPSGHGSILRHTRLKDREIFVPVVIHGADIQECDRLRDQLITLLDPSEGPLRIEVTSPHRAVRYIEAVYSDGLTGDYGEGYYGSWQSLGLRFKAASAFFSGERVTRMWQIAPGVKPLISASQPFFPVTLASSTIGGQMVIPIIGDKPVWPMFTITGPGNDPVIENLGTGQKLSLSGLVPGRQSITLDTEPGTISSPGIPAEQLWPRLSLDSDFFQLGPGQCRLKMRLTSASETSTLTISYVPQYRAGY